MRANLDPSALDALCRALRTVREGIANAAQRSGRSQADVTLVVVTKAASSAVVEALAGLGVRDVGENRVQQMRDRHAMIGSGLRWHMIGHLQRNKVGPAIEIAHLIHSVDSTRLLDALSNRASSRGRRVDVLLEINVSGEVAKHGFRPEEAPAALEHAAGLDGLRVRGLMTMAPMTDDVEETRPVFAGLRELRDDLDRRACGPEPLRDLSMGMTQDYEVAVEEGATLVRVGSAIVAGQSAPVAGEGSR